MLRSTPYSLKIQINRPQHPKRPTTFILRILICSDSLLVGVAEKSRCTSHSLKWDIFLIYYFFSFSFSHITSFQKNYFFFVSFFFCKRCTEFVQLFFFSPSGLEKIVMVPKGKISAVYFKFYFFAFFRCKIASLKNCAEKVKGSALLL